MHNGLSLLLLITGLASVLAALPQLFRLLRVKTSKELSLFSWTVWLAYQCVSVAYAAYIHATAYAIINALWVVFYAAMVSLIVRYRSTAPS